MSRLTQVLPGGCERRLPVFLERRGAIKFYYRPHLPFFSTSTNAAALILATWIAANPPLVVMQSHLGIDIQVGHNRLIGLVRRNSGILPFKLGITMRSRPRACPRCSTLDSHIAPSLPPNVFIHAALSSKQSMCSRECASRESRVICALIIQLISEGHSHGQLLFDAREGRHLVKLRTSHSRVASQLLLGRGTNHHTIGSPELSNREHSWLDSPSS